MRLLAPGLAVLMAVSACSAGERLPTEAEETAYVEQFPPPDAPQEYFLYTHCGLRPIRVGGEWWVPTGWSGSATLPSEKTVTERWGDYELGELTYRPPTGLSFTADGETVEYSPGPAPADFCR